MGLEGVLVVEDDAQLAAEIVAGCSMRVPATAVGRGDRALELVSANRAGWLGAVVDVGLPDQSGIEVVRKLRRVVPNLPTLVLTGRDERSLANQAVAEGAHFAYKPLALAELHAFVGHAVTAHPDGRMERAMDEFARVHGLTAREREIVWLTIVGVRRPALLGRFGITENTLKTHLARLRAKCREPSMDAVVRRIFERALGWT